MNDAWWWWPHGRPNASERAVLFFPPAGADQAVARTLIDDAAGMAFGVLRLPGRGVRHHEPAPTAAGELVEAIGDSISDRPGLPPVLVGHSFGGLLAFGTAATLEAKGHTVGRLVTVASSPPVGWAASGDDGPAASSEERDRHVERRTDTILADAGLAPGLVANGELVAATRQLIAIDLTLAYDRFRVGSVACPITAVAAHDDRIVEAETCRAWEGFTRGSFRTLTFPGGHFFYRDSPDRLMNLLRMEVAALDDIDEG